MKRSLVPSSNGPLASGGQIEPCRPGCGIGLCLGFGSYTRRTDRGAVSFCSLSVPGWVPSSAILRTSSLHWSAVRMISPWARRRRTCAGLREVSVPLAVGLRRAAHRPGAYAGVTADPDGPGVLILGPRNETLMANDTADRWLGELSTGVWCSPRRSAAITPQVAGRPGGDVSPKNSPMAWA
jgi:hypothetical protein